MLVPVVAAAAAAAAAAAVRSHFRVLLAGDVHSLQDQLDTLPKDFRNSFVEIREVAQAEGVEGRSPVVDIALVVVGTEDDFVEGSGKRTSVRVEERPGFDRGTPWGCRDRSLIVYHQKTRNLEPTLVEPPVIASTGVNWDRKSWK